MERNTSGKGQVIDAAMTDGTASLLSPFFGLMSMGMWTTDRYANRLDGGAYYAMVAGSQGAGTAIVAVLASTFSAVIVVLARIVLREHISAAQWCGIALILAGVATLSALQA